MKKLLLMIGIILLFPMATVRATPPPASTIILFMQRRIIDTLPAGLVPTQVIVSGGGFAETHDVNDPSGQSWVLDDGKGILNVSSRDVMAFNGATEKQYAVTWSSIPFGTVGKINVKTAGVNDQWLSKFRWATVDPENNIACNSNVDGTMEGSVCRYWDDRNYLQIKNRVKIIWTMGITESDEDISRIFSPNPGTIYGNVASATGGVNLGDFLIDENSIIASKTNISGNRSGDCTTTTMGVRICGYGSSSKSKMDWSAVHKTLLTTAAILKNERAKYYCTSYITTSGARCSISTPTSINGSWNLQNGRRSDNTLRSNDPNSASLVNTKLTPPEGEVWYIDGDLILDNVTFAGRGTVIVAGNLTIAGNVVGGDSSAMLGIIANTVTITPATNDVQAIIYADGAADGIVIQKRDDHEPLQFTGLLASRGNVRLPVGNGEGSTFVYDNRIQSNPLPGFKELIGKLITTSETAP